MDRVTEAKSNPIILNCNSKDDVLATMDIFGGRGGRRRECFTWILVRAVCFDAGSQDVASGVTV